MANLVKVGDRVAYSTHFLRSMAESATSRRWGDRGVVESDTDCDCLVVVCWADARRTTVNRANLTNTRKGLNQDCPMALGDAWVGMGFQSLHGARI